MPQATVSTGQWQTRQPHSAAEACMAGGRGEVVMFVFMAGRRSVRKSAYQTLAAQPCCGTQHEVALLPHCAYASPVAQCAKRIKRQHVMGAVTETRRAAQRATGGPTSMLARPAQRKRWRRGGAARWSKLRRRGPRMRAAQAEHGASCRARRRRHCANRRRGRGCRSRMQIWPSRGGGSRSTPRSASGRPAPQPQDAGDGRVR
jgi:hypothetical protein